MPTPGLAAGAYAKLAGLTNAPTSLAKTIGGASETESGQSFGALLKDVVGAVTEAGRKSDAQAQAMAAGKANIVDVVTAVSETEVAIDAVVSVRDKVIQAYEEIMRMPI
ncbi:MAG TPA: flagellar hook-basal body complex protein FliE [Xanthobacteraceae bacterium]|nr:flagellar hook-basal body complex protein FliE [Xanthobacteraceae bacterium]